MATKTELKKMLKAPIELAHNTFKHFYNGGKLRAEFVGEKNPKDDFRSEEWIFSTNTCNPIGVKNKDPEILGISRIKTPSGQKILITELLEKLPIETLGQAHCAKFGPKLGILVKIFDVGDNAHIPVHWHPSPKFSKKYLNSDYGKNEAWVVVGTRPGAKAWIGFKEDVAVEDFRRWMEAQDVEEMRRHMYEVEPKTGDVIFLLDSQVHSLGSGLCILEPQEPTDWNILAEWNGYPYTREQASQMLGWDTALKAVKFEKMDETYLREYVMRTPKQARKQNGSVEYDLVPKEARKYFWLQRQIVKGALAMPGNRGFYVLIGVGGQGELRGPWGAKKIKRGRSYFITASLPGYDLVRTSAEPLEVVTCYPPAVR